MCVLNGRTEEKGEVAKNGCGWEWFGAGRIRRKGMIGKRDDGGLEGSLKRAVSDRKDPKRISVEIGR